MKEVWELCRRLNNPTRLKLLMDVYSQKLDDGLNVGIAMDDNSLKQSATSAHLSALASLGIIRRCRSGRFVNYYPEISEESPSVAEIARLTKEKKRLEGELKRSAGMLRNEKFLSKAPAEKIAAEKEKQQKYEQQMAGVIRELEELSAL